LNQSYYTIRILNKISAKIYASKAAFLFGLVVVALVLSANTAFGQKLSLMGKLRVDGGSNNGAQIIVEKDGRRVRTIEGTSRFELDLDFQAIYVISFEKEGFVTKKIRFDTHVADERIEYGFEPFGFTVEIFKQYDDVNMVVFNQPVGKIAYDEMIDEFDYDTDYTKSIQAQLDQAMDDVEAAKEAEEDKALQEAKAEEQLNEQISDLTASALKNEKAENYDEAIQALKEANDLRKDPALKQKIEELEQKKEQQQAAQKKQEEFNDIIAQAEAAMANGDLDNANRFLQQADGLLSGDPKVAKLKADIEKQQAEAAAKEQQIADLLQEAKSALDAGQFDDAIKAGKEAEKLGSPDAGAIVAQAETAKSEAEAAAAVEAAKQQAFEDLMAEADKLQAKGELEAALGKLNEAKAQIDNEAVAGKITELNQLIEAEAKAAEEAAAKQAEMTALLDEAEAALQAGDLEGAKAKLEAAGALGEDPRIKELQAGILEKEEAIAKEAEAKAEQEAKITSLAGEVEQLITAGDLDKASSKLDELGSIDNTVPAYTELSKKLEDEKARIAAEEEAKAAQEAAKQKEFDDLIAAGAQQEQSGALEDAKASYEKALAVKDDPQASDGISRVEKAIADRDKAQQEELEAAQKADALIAEAKTDLEADDFASARKKLTDAKDLRDDQAVNDLLALVDQKEAERNDQLEKEKLAAEEAEKKAEEEKQYADLIAKADAEFEKNNLDKAAQLYNDALAVKQESYPQSQIQKISEKKLEAEQLAAAEQAAKEEEEQAKKDEAERLAAAEAEAKAAAEAEKEKLAQEEAAAKEAEKAEKDRLKAEEEAEKERLAQAEADKKAAEAEAKAATKAAEEQAKKEEEDRLAQEEAEAKAAEDAAKAEKERLAQEEAAAKQAAKDAEEQAKREEEERLAAEAAAKTKAEEERLAAQETENAAAKAEQERLRKEQEAKKQREAQELAAKAEREAQEKAAQEEAERQRLAKEKEEAKAAAMALTNQAGRESEQLANIIAEEEKNAQEKAASGQDTPPASQSSSPQVGDQAPSFGFAQPVMESEERPTGFASNVIISDNKVGQEARDTQTGQMSEDDKYDGLVKRAEAQQAEFYEDETRKALVDKYPEKKTVETYKEGNSTVTMVYINKGDYVTTYKKVEHNWGGTYFFIDGQSTNQRFWEHETQ